MSYKVRPVYASSAPGAKVIAWAVIDKDGIEVKREIHKVNAQNEAQRLNKEKGARHLVRL